MRLRFRLISTVFVLTFLLTGISETGAQTIAVAATVETPPVAHSGDSADDPAVWIHPTDPSLSTVIGTDKEGALEVYSLAGAILQRLTGMQPNNVDLRYNFPLAGSSVALVTFGNVDSNSIGVYKVNAATRLLENVANGALPAGFSVYGSCMYRSSASSKYYLFITAKSGEVRQYELVGNAGGRVSATQVRTFDVGDQVEGCAADDELGYFYVGEEDFGIWKYSAEPTGGTARTLVDGVASGRLEADVEGLSIYYAVGGTGYLLASSQGASEFVIYRREGANPYVGTFEIVAGKGIDDVSGTDGIDVSNLALGGGFPMGVFVAQDGSNNGNQNFKLVPWERIANAFKPPLTIDLDFDPRRGRGSGNPGNLPPQ